MHLVYLIYLLYIVYSILIAGRSRQQGKTISLVLFIFQYYNCNCSRKGKTFSKIAFTL